MAFSHKKIKRSCPEYKQIIEQKSYDWISNLPTDILQCILSFLDTTEVVKTTVLSRKWRYIWGSMAHFKFNFKEFCEQEHCLALSDDDCISKFWEFVKTTFNKKDNSPIHKLKFSCDYFDVHQLKLLLSLCAAKNVQKLELMAGYGIQPEYGIQECPLSWLVSNDIAAFMRNISSLVELQTFTGFGNLKTLHLVRVQFPDAHMTEKLFSDCGVLENLSLEHCCFLITKFLNISANKLKKLNFINMGPNWCGCDCIFEGRLKLYTPNLVSFYYFGPEILQCEYSDMLFLKHASILVHYHASGPSSVSPVFGAMCLVIQHVEELSVSSAFVLLFYPVIGRPRHNFTPFDHLRCLRVDLERSAGHIEGLINLLQLSPNLEVLCIKVYKGWWRNRDRWEPREKDVHFLCHNLKEIELVCTCYFPDAVELIKFFLLNGKSLERIKFVQKFKMMHPGSFYALHGVQSASDEVSVSVSSISASGKKELFEFVFGKCGEMSAQTKNSKKKSTIRRSKRIARKAGGSS